ncbi:hypothetical protein [Pararobbsia alpina]|uniref:Uncharacterized protein n=1 Tax=Pararobbsia alpina TaxID=621374 RepID=A0A6S7D2B4_9BURK|nr:hypothetical protein [Pararobbsia alpina]CAB3794235.1 hypothetical protein LMG28138_03651 [Pararobbsia alpina]
MRLRLCMIVLLSLPLAIALSGAFAWAMPGGWQRSGILAIVLFLPLWIGIQCSAFALSSTSRVVIVLGCSNFIGFALLFAARAMHTS